MIGLKAFGALELVQGALMYALLLWTRRVSKRDGVEEYKQEAAERRSLRRLEKRTTAYTAKHQAAPWPGPDTDQLATTDQLRKLAEDGDLAEIARTNAAFMRIFDLIAWNRKRETAA